MLKQMIDGLDKLSTALTLLALLCLVGGWWMGVEAANLVSQINATAPPGIVYVTTSNTTYAVTWFVLTTFSSYTPSVASPQCSALTCTLTSTATNSTQVVPEMPLPVMVERMMEQSQSLTQDRNLLDDCGTVILLISLVLKGVYSWKKHVVDQTGNLTR